jgi:hypothetical protein
MPSFIAREPIYVLPDGTTTHEPAEGARRIAGRGQILTEAAQRRYGLVNPDLPVPPEPDPAADDAPAAEPKRPPRARSRR